MLSRFSLYIDEVARRGSIRKASEHLHIAQSAIDRQILQAEERMGVKLFERTPQGLKLTAAGELVVESVRRWRRDSARLKGQIDDLQGLKRGDVSIAVVEGAIDFLSQAMSDFRKRFPGINYQLRVTGSTAVPDLVLKSEVEIGITFNPPDTQGLRIERTLIYQLGAVATPGHPLTELAEATVLDCNDHPLIIPDESISLRAVIDQIWAKNCGAAPRAVAVSDSINSIKSMVRNGLGVGILTPIEAKSELASGQLVFVPLAGPHIPLSVLSIISGSGRTLSVPASLMLQQLGKAMELESAPAV
jgi:DNA-binding transcriptional LysR family regulator